MSDYVPPSAYERLSAAWDNFNCQFRLLLMHIFMDDLHKEQLLKFYFLCEMPERLRDEEAVSHNFRFAILKYAEQQLMHEWSRAPESLQELLVEAGRTDLSIKLGALVARYRDEPAVCPEGLPVQETQDTSTANVSPRHKTRLENIPEEIAASLDQDGHASLKRTPSTASEARSSGYFSNPRSSEPRFSQLSIPESLIEAEEKENVPQASIKQISCDKDEGLILDIDYTDDFTSSLKTSGDFTKCLETSGVERLPSESDSSTLSSDSGDSPTRMPFRDRSYQYFGKRRPSKQNTFDEFDTSEPHRGRSASLPSCSRDMHSRQLHSTNFGSSNSSIDSSTSGSSYACDSTSNSLQRQPAHPVETELSITGSMKIDTKNILKSIDKKDSPPVISGEFPSKKQGYRGPCYEMRLIPSDFSKKNASLYVDVARSYLRKKSKKEDAQSLVNIPPLTVSLTLLSSNSVSGCETCAELGSDACCGIKSMSVKTEQKCIDSRSNAKEKGLVASFPQMISHEELKTLDSGRSLVIRVNISHTT